jgi:hypothetical protein
MFKTIREFLFGKKSTPAYEPDDGPLTDDQIEQIRKLSAAPYKIESPAAQEKPVEEVPVVTVPAPVAAPVPVAAAPVMTPARKKPATRPVAKPAAKPVAKPIAKPAAKPSAKPARKKPVAK